jgi:predicted chitinase
MAPIPITRAEYAAKFGGATSVSSGPILITRAEYQAKFGKPEVSEYQPEGTLTDTLLNLGGAANRAADMGTLGLSTKLGSGISALLSKVSGDERPLGELYTSARAENEASMQNLPTAAKILSSGVGLGASMPINITKGLKAPSVVKAIAEGAAQSGISAYGHDQEVLPALLTGGGVSGGLNVVGKGVGALANVAGDAAQATKNKLYGLQYSDIAQSLKKDVVSSKATQAPIVDAMNRLIDQGTLKAGKASENYARTLQQRKPIQDALNAALQQADNVQVNPIVPQFTKAQEIISKLDPSEQKAASKMLSSLESDFNQANTGMVSDLENLKRSYQKSGAASFGLGSTDKLEAKLKGAMSTDIKSAIDNELADPIYGALGNQVKAIRQAGGDRAKVSKALLKAKAREDSSDILQKITNLARTTGGYGVPMIVGGTTAGPAGALLAFGAAKALNTTTGQKALIKGLQGVAKAEPLGQLAQQLAPMAGRLTADARAENKQAEPTTALSTLKKQVEGVKVKAEDNKSILLKEMSAAGITDPVEANQFLAQMEHESAGFKKLKEVGSGTRYEGRKDLGNTQKGDGERFKGRGFIQLTGRDNYKKFGDLIGVDLISNPELAEQPDIAAKIAIAYWNSRVKPKVSDFNDIKKVTKIINGGYNGLADREKRFAALQALADKARV